MRQLDLIRLRGWSRLVGRPPTRFLGRTIVTDSIVPQNDDGDEAKSRSSKFNQTAFKVFESAAITFASIAILGISGYMYHEYYQHRVVAKIRRAFEKGDPSLDLAMWSRTGEGEVEWVMRDEQDVINRAVSGKGLGRYYLMIGEKGTGKTSMLLEAMRRVSALHCAMFEAHADPEIVRIRLGKAINYDYHEDYIGSLFSIRGPRDTTALLDIERAFDKLEEVALYEVKKTGQPLVLIVNSTHLLRDDADGENLVELLQQRAESFAASGLVTMIFNSDDYWVYERFKRLGTRLDVVTIHDLSREMSVESLRMWRRKYFGDEPALTTEVCNKVYDIVGGRPQFLNRVAQHRDMLGLARSIVDNERTWFLNQCGLLGMDMDDDVMESGKFSGSAMLLMKELVDMDKAYRTEHGEPAADDDHDLPSLPLWRARQVMTRADYIQKYDNLNIFTIDSNSMVRADSTAMMEAFRQIAATPGFDKLLEDTLDRVSQIESLGRTRELVAKDLVGGIGKYKITFEKGKEILVQVVPPPDDGGDDDNDDDD